MTETPFHMLIVGMTACRKTHYLLKILEENFKGHFDYVEWKFIKDPDVSHCPATMMK